MIRYMGIRYYVPITKEFKKEFKVKRCKQRYEFLSYKSEKRIEDFLRDIISSVYLQIQDTIGSEIYQQLNRNLEQGFSKLFEIHLGKNRKVANYKDATF